MLAYDPLEHFLAQQPGDEVPMTFEQFERIIGRKLPHSAYKEGNAWWSNNATNHSQAKAWLSAGFEAVNVVRKAKKLVFKRVKNETPQASAPHEFRHSENNQPRRSPLFGALKDTFTIEPGYDLAQPALPTEEWLELLKAKYSRDARK
ncbi:MAG: hypothetical protein KGM97_08585 [Alphaproteobacteria bacterium]|nr:hypothetical protein [Alphaproteobacteria bacterium]MDE2631031.1 hypothetical protein [Alphaproteobacteria bacterium]